MRSADYLWSSRYFLDTTRIARCPMFGLSVQVLRLDVVIVNRMQILPLQIVAMGAFLVIFLGGVNADLPVLARVGVVPFCKRTSLVSRSYFVWVLKKNQTKAISSEIWPPGSKSRSLSRPPVFPHHVYKSPLLMTTIFMQHWATLASLVDHRICMVLIF